MMKKSTFTWRTFHTGADYQTKLGLCYLDGKPYSRVFPGAALIATEHEARNIAQGLLAEFIEEPLPPYEYKP